MLRQISEITMYGEDQNMRKKKDLRKLLNLNYLNLTNKTRPSGEFDLPAISCSVDIVPDYLALYNQPGDYHKTPYTGVCFYNYDNIFDGKDGIFNAIYHNDKKLLEQFYERFKNVKYIISPDYSQFGDLHKIENLIRLWKSRIVTLWFIIVVKAVAIPNITYISEKSFPLFFSGLEDCEVVAFSTKGHVRYVRERNLLKEAVKYAVENLPLKTIVLYSVCGKDETSLKLFDYALERGIRVIIPNNSLRERNQRRCSLL